MAKVKAKGKAAKVKKKLWFDIVADESFKHATIGQSHVEEKEQLLGKSIRVNLNELTGDPKKQNILVQFKVDKLKAEKGVAHCIGYKLNASSIKRMMRRGKNRIDFSYVFKSKDGKNLRIKPFLVTRFASTKVTV
jgi:small subunit ribosomal protein S3Ae